MKQKKYILLRSKREINKVYKDSRFDGNGEKNDMKKEQIERLIKRYSSAKTIITWALLLAIIALVFFSICVYVIKEPWSVYGAVITYGVTVLLVIIAFAFPLGKALTDVITLDDYKGILEYLSQIPSDMRKQEYLDSLILIKRALFKTVYYHMNGIGEIFRQHLCYLQGFIFLDESKKIIPSKLLDRTYVREISKLLLQQINQNKFEESLLNNLTIGDESKEKYNSISAKMLTRLCNIILILFVTIKFIITINFDWYQFASSNLFVRTFYNTSIDIIAVFLAIIAWKEE